MCLPNIIIIIIIITVTVGLYTPKLEIISEKFGADNVTVTVGWTQQVRYKHACIMHVVIQYTVILQLNVDVHIQVCCHKLIMILSP